MRVNRIVHGACVHHLSNCGRIHRHHPEVLCHLIGFVHPFSTKHSGPVLGSCRLVLAMNRAALGSCAERRIGFTPDSMFLTFTLSIFSVAGLCSLLTGAAVDSLGERLCRSDWVGEHFTVISVAGRCLGWQRRLEPQHAIGRVGSDSPLIQFSMANYRQVFHLCFYRFSLL